MDNIIKLDLKERRSKTRIEFMSQLIRRLKVPGENDELRRESPARCAQSNPMEERDAYVDAEQSGEFSE